MTINTRLISVLLVLCAWATGTQASLTDQGNGLITDSDQNMTWLKDANQVKTSCDANDSLWIAFDPTTVANNSGRNKTTICSDNGDLNWYEAEAWIAALNAASYLGYNDWRQPATNQPDASCSHQAVNAGFDDQGYGYNCTGSEMGYLWNAAAPGGLDNPNHGDDVCGPNCLQNTGPFENLQSFAYWGGTVYAPVPTNAWSFWTIAGDQNGAGSFPNHFSVWPVRSGQSVAVAQPVPVPGLGFWGVVLTSLLLLGLTRRRIRSFG